MLANKQQKIYRLTAGVAVESKVVLGAGGKTGDLVLGGKSGETGRENGRGNLALESQNVGSETSNMGRSHGGTGDGVLIFLLACCTWKIRL